MQILFYDTGETLHNAETSFLHTVLLNIWPLAKHELLVSCNLNTDLCKVFYNSEALNSVPFPTEDTDLWEEQIL